MFLRPLNRKSLRRSAYLAVLALVAAGCSGQSADKTAAMPTQTYVSRPDLSAPIAKPTAADLAPSDTSGDVVLLGLKGDDCLTTGPIITDATGEPIWIGPTTKNAFDVRVQQYQGQPVLTWWSGKMVKGYGHGKVTIMNSSYQKIATVTTGGDLKGVGADIHEATLTPQGTMLVTAYKEVKHDLSKLDGPKDGYVLDGIVQEIDVATGKVKFEWHSLDHVPVSNTVSSPKGASDDDDDDTGTKDAPFDYFHINSISLDSDGGLLVSSRNTSAVYKVSHQTGDIEWILGGKASSFTMGKDATFWWQHDAERQADGTITLYDNESSPDKAKTSRGLRLKLDMSTMTATVVTQYRPPTTRLSGSQGSVQVLDNGNVFVGWGSKGYYSEFTSDGTIISDMAIGGCHSYRAFKQAWVGTPTDAPAAAFDDSKQSVKVSWNGATQVASWRLVTGPDEASAAPQAPVAKKTFETTLPVPDDAAYVKVQALDAQGNVIGETTAS